MISTKRDTILIVDDVEKSREFLAKILHREGYHTLTAGNGREAIEVVQNTVPDLILMDVIMPEMDGIECTRQLRGFEETEYTPIIIVTASNDRDNRIRGIESGANDFLLKPIDSQELLLRIKNNLQMKEYQDLLGTYNMMLEQEVAGKEREIESLSENVVMENEELRSTWREVIRSVAKALEYKDFENAGHLSRLSMYTALVSREYGLDPRTCELYSFSAYLHDIGKMGITDKVILKGGPLSPDEWEIMKSHTSIGGQILEGASPLMQIAKRVAMYHHENWDGSGYPKGLAGEEIPLEARIVAVCDRYDVIRSKRPYKESVTHEDACRILLEGDVKTKPGHFEPKILEIFRKCSKEFEEIFASYNE